MVVPTDLIIDLTKDSLLYSPYLPNHSIQHCDLKRSHSPRWINVKRWKNIPFGHWRGIDHGDGLFRLYQKPHHRLRDHSLIKQHCKQGRLIQSFNILHLLKIAWMIGVTNFEGFDRTDCNFFGITMTRGFQLYLTGWNNINKEILSTYIWNKLEETDCILII
jgi:hypothetical protein